MGQKVNPIGIRLGYTKTSASRWYASNKNFAKYLHERPAKNARITIHTARPGVIIGRNGKDIELLRNEIAKMIDIPVHININEIKKPDLDSKLAAESIAQQLERRVSFRRAVKRAISNAMRNGAKGIKVCVSGRLGGAEIARTEWYKEGRIPLHTFRADIDYGTARASTTYGIIGVKVWVFKGEVTAKHIEPSVK